MFTNKSMELALLSFLCSVSSSDVLLHIYAYIIKVKEITTIRSHNVAYFLSSKLIKCKENIQLS